MNAVEIRNLSKNFGSKQAVCGLNMTVPMGAIYGFIGENGSGKSTTEKMICGLIPTSGGSIKLYGKDYTDQAVRAKVGVLIVYFIGAMLGGAISGLSFDLGALTTGNIVMCMLAKVFLMLVFVAIDVAVSVGAKQKTWLCLCGSLGAGMLLFMMVSMITPLGSTMMNVILCLLGGALFSVGLGVVSTKILGKTSLV